MHGLKWPFKSTRIVHFLGITQSVALDLARSTALRGAVTTHRHSIALAGLRLLALGRLGRGNLLPPTFRLPLHNSFDFISLLKLFRAREVVVGITVVYLFNEFRFGLSFANQYPRRGPTQK
eukprot:COSAG05_NODE_1787_length_4092_cov_1.788380_2_plen_121_part_00